VLVVHGTTRQFNPTFSQKVIDKALAKDPQRYAAEYNSAWRDDLATFIDRELLESAIEAGVIVRPPLQGLSYVAAVDSGSGRSDSFTLAIAHKELRADGSVRVVLDLIYEKMPPYNPNSTIIEIAAILRQYHCNSCVGDRYSVGFVADGFRKERIEYRESSLDRSEGYLGFLPIMAAGQGLLLDHKRMVAQFAGLVRRTGAIGKDKVDHEVGAHDDVANAVALAMVLASREEQKIYLGPPVIIYSDGSDSGLQSAALNHQQPTPLSDEAHAARMRAYEPSVPRAPSAPTSTSLWYENNGGYGGGFAEIGGRTKRETF
jgi:hypothetical protein